MIEGSTRLSEKLKEQKEADIKSLEEEFNSIQESHSTVELGNSYSRLSGRIRSGLNAKCPSA